MKFVTFEVPTLLGNISRAGALAQVGDGQVVLDLAHGYAALLQEEGRGAALSRIRRLQASPGYVRTHGGGGTIS